MAEATFSLDLHVLSPPLTFALSQDQTLHRKFEPALRRLIAALRGEAASDVEWFLTYVTKPIIFRWLAIQFSETEPGGSGSRRRSSPRFVVEGCCLYAAGFGASTLIAEFYADRTVD